MFVASGAYRQPKKKKSIFLRIALIVFALYAVTVMVQLVLEIREKEAILAGIHQSNQQLETDNNVMKDDLGNRDELLNDAAHDSGYVNSGDGIYKESN